MADILLVGGSGFVSGTMARTAVAAGHRVWVITRGQRPLPDGVRGLIADRKDTHSVRQAVRGAGTTFDLVVDCIAYAPEDAQQDIAVFRETAAHLVLISTDFVYDPARRQLPQPESPAAYTPTPGYGHNKRLCELELERGDTGAMRWNVLRPCHIYGAGSQLGCLPEHGRDPKLIARLRAGEPLRLVGGGHFLQQPIFAPDLATLALSLLDRADLHGHTFNAAGPDIVESRTYYQHIAKALGVELKVEETPVSAYAAAHPEAAPFLCHRIYDLSRLRSAGLAVPATALKDGLREHVASLVGSEARNPKSE